MDLLLINGEDCAQNVTEGFFLVQDKSSTTGIIFICHHPANQLHNTQRDHFH